MGLHMEDPLYSGDVTSLVTSACVFTLVDEDPATLPFFGAVTDDGKVDYNLDNCFETLEDVDNLLSSGPDLDFESVTSSHPDVMEWDDSSASPPGTAVKKSIDGFDLKLDFVPIVTSLPILPLEDSEDLCIEDPAKEQHFGHQLQAQFIGEDTLPAGKELGVFHTTPSMFGKFWRVLGDSVQVIAGISPFPRDRGNTAIVLETSGNSQPSTVSHSDSRKANMAQVQRVRRHAGNNRRRCENRTKRKLNRQPKIHQVNYPPYNNLQASILHPTMPLHLSTTQVPGHLHRSSVPTIVPGYASISPQPIGPQVLSPYIHHVGCNNPPIQQPLPPLAPNHVQVQIMQSQGLPLGSQTENVFQQIKLPPHQESHLWASSEALIRPVASSPPILTVQQMQAQNCTLVDSSEALCNGITQLPHVLALSQPEVVAPIMITSAPRTPAVLECDSELSPTGQMKVEGMAAAENGGTSSETVVLDQLLKATKMLGTETQLCIRDALYRLAQSATKKQALLGGVHIDGSDTAYSSHLSEEVDAKTSDGADISIESDPLSTNKASRMNVETNPIDHSTARLLFHKKWHLASGQVKPNVDDGAHLGRLSNSPLKRQHCNVSLGNWVSNPQVTPFGEVDQRTSKTLEQQNKYINLPSLATENPQVGGGHQQQQSRVGESYILNTEQHFESPVGSESCSATNNEQQRVIQSSSQGLLTTPGQVTSSKVKNIGPSKQLEHAIGLKELSQLLSEGLEIPGFSVYEEEGQGFAHSSPLGSLSSGFNEFQASNFTKRSDRPGLVAIPKTLIEQRG